MVVVVVLVLVLAVLVAGDAGVGCRPMLVSQSHSPSWGYVAVGWGRWILYTPAHLLPGSGSSFLRQRVELLQVSF